MKDDPKADTYSEEETVARREAALKRMLATPHKPHKEQKRPKRCVQRRRRSPNPARRLESN
jgi:hypothetical protein